MNPALRPYLGHFLSQLAACGVQDAVIAPGSRSTPLAILLRELPNVRVTVGLDERSAAFFALGIAKSANRPVVLVCTSGTAAANFFPAVAEAFLSRVPLVVLTADRPRELRDVGAPQTLDQVNLYGSHAKWFQELPEPSSANLNFHAAQVAARAVHRALSHPAGPVHINIPLREPLLPDPGQPAPALMGPQFAPQELPSRDALDMARQWIEQSERPILLLGPESMAIDSKTLTTARQKALPVLADPLAKTGRPDSVLTAYDTFLRRDAAPARPDLVVRLGAPMTSKALTQWCADARLILADWPLGFRDPEHHASLVIEGDPSLTLAALVDEMPAKPRLYAAEMSSVESQAEARIDEVVRMSPPYFEGRFYREVVSLWNPAMPVLAASSMSIRDFDTFYGHGGLMLYSNRGANGIDGLVSTALGLSYNYGDVLAVLGDLAFHHDLTGLLYGQKYALNALIVIVNNGGGGIFSHLSQSSLDTETFEELFGTPHQVDFSGAATLYGAVYRKVHDYDDFQQQFLDLRKQPGLRIIDWQVSPRAESVIVHRQLYSRAGLG